jgi:hypothetical protein
MKHLKRISSHQQEEQQSQLAEHQAQSQGSLEFRSPEELLRHDAVHTPVPPGIQRRLEESIAREGIGQKRPWWRRLFST